MNDKENVRTPSGRKPKTFAAWQEIRRRNPTAYYSATTSKKVMEDRLTLGEAFYTRKEGEDDDL